MLFVAFEDLRNFHKALKLPSNYDGRLAVMWDDIIDWASSCIDCSELITFLNVGT